METRMTGTFNRVQLDPGIRYALASAYIFLANIVRTCVRVYKYVYIYVYVCISIFVSTMFEGHFRPAS